MPTYEYDTQQRLIEAARKYRKEHPNEDEPYTVTHVLRQEDPPMLKTRYTMTVKYPIPTDSQQTRKAKLLSVWNQNDTLPKVYAIQCRLTRCVKIGYTHHPIRGRLSTLQTSCPGELSLLGFHSYDDPYQAQRAEKTAHKTLVKHRSHGEWYHWTPEVIAYLKELIP